MSFRRMLKKTWRFIWHDDSIWSWVINIILAFILVRFIIYPGIGLVMGTSFPIVAVVSGSMEHDGNNFDAWWENNKDWYMEKGISEEQFMDFPFKNGFNKGDIMFLRGAEPKDIKIGDVVVYQTPRHENPIIHRVVEIKNAGNAFVTKGDNNAREDPDAVDAIQIQNTGRAVARLPLLGWVKIIFVEVFS